MRWLAIASLGAVAAVSHGSPQQSCTDIVVEPTSASVPAEESLVYLHVSNCGEGPCWTVMNTSEPWIGFGAGSPVPCPQPYAIYFNVAENTSTQPRQGQVRGMHEEFGVLWTITVNQAGASAPPCPADINGDHSVDASDLATVLGNWGGSGAADINGDGTVNASDLAIVLGTWGTCPDPPNSATYPLGDFFLPGGEIAYRERVGFGIPLLVSIQFVFDSQSDGSRAEDFALVFEDGVHPPVVFGGRDSVLPGQVWAGPWPFAGPESEANGSYGGTLPVPEGSLELTGPFTVGVKNAWEMSPGVLYRQVQIAAAYRLENCTNGVDDDDDGLVDCQDPNCCFLKQCQEACDDGNPCTIDTCVDGDCVHTPFCDDGDPCTLDTCVDGECVHTPRCGEGLEQCTCDDGDPCTDDVCQQGVCVHTDHCDDGLECTEDICTLNKFGGVQCIHLNGCTPLHPVWDVDQDGYCSATCGGDDCDDTNPQVHPNAVEVCDNGIDDDCDGLVDCHDPDCFASQVCPPTWGTVLEWDPDPAVVLREEDRAAITATGLPWRVRDDATGIELLLVPPGEFTMGCQQPPCEPDELPPHSVTISQPFYLSRHEVTQQEWLSVMDVNPSYFQGDFSRPVEFVSWDLIQLFEEKSGMRLPTEAEWEYACRAGTPTAYNLPPNGTNDPTQLGLLAWYSENSGGQTHPVGEKQANNLGFHDTHGNVWEWCEDWYGSDYYSQSPAIDPTGPASGAGRVLRGGSWFNNSYGCRAALRDFDDPDSRGNNLGFRVARTP